MPGRGRDAPEKEMSEFKKRQREREKMRERERERAPEKENKRERDSTPPRETIPRAQHPTWASAVLIPMTEEI